MNIEYPKVGILGGGQLARLLALKAHQLGMMPYIFSAHPDDPAALVTKNWIQGDAQEVAALKSFLEQVDVASFESEFLDAQKLLVASKLTHKSVFPACEIMDQLQDRNSQKTLLDQFKIAVVPWIFVNTCEQARQVFQSLSQSNKQAMILKKCRFGYDGYGTFQIQIETDLKAAFLKQDAFGFIAEAKIKFKRELAFMMVRDQFGNILSLPLVETRQENSCCVWVKGPVHHRGFKKLEKQFRKLLESLNYVGALGIELFDCGGNLLVNEIAPRVHNSAHYSLDALSHDQFSLHLMAVMGLKLPKKLGMRSKAFAMLNLLGVALMPKLASEDVFLHWYEKNEVRPGRKMGHLTALATHPDLALHKLLTLQRKFILARNV
jgi:5-(carboxyamino)imidazole ribonucleotide synthase